MKRVLVVGAAGGLGKMVLKELKDRGYFVRALVRGEDDAHKILRMADEIFIGDALEPKSLNKICDGIDIVFSALGKSLSLFSNDEKTFFEVDYAANKNILEKAKESGINRFVYISIYGSDLYGDSQIATAHRQVERSLFNSGMSYTIIRPVGIFVGMLDVLRMAKNGIVITVGDGENKTNPIHEVDLAIACADHIEKGPEVLEVGGPTVYTRNQIAELAIKAANSGEHIHIPASFVQGSLPFFKFYDKGFFDKLMFFQDILTNDAVAPKSGSKKLANYFNQHVDRLEENWLDLIV